MKACIHCGGTYLHDCPETEPQPPTVDERIEEEADQWASKFTYGRLIKGAYAEGLRKNYNRIKELEEENEKMRALLDVIPGMAGNPDPAEGCRLIIKRVQKTRQALGQEGEG
jgi:hypothetical protein